MPEEELEDIELIGLVEGTVDDLKQYVRENDLEDEELEKILQAEREAKDRKTAKGFLRNRMDREPEIEDTGTVKDGSEGSDEDNDIEETVEEPDELEIDDGIEREELLKMLGGTVEEMKEWVREKDPSDEQLQEILHAERIVNDRKTAVSFLKSYSKREELKEDIKEAERDFQELRNDLDRIEEVLDEDIDLSGIELEEDIQPGKEEAGNEEDIDSGSGEEGKGTEESGEEPDEEQSEDPEASESEEDSAEDEDGNKEYGSDEDETLEEKKEIAEELDTDLSEEQLEEISLGELKSIREEKEEREELIEFLEDDFDEEKLREASTSDLKKLKQNVQESEEDEPEDDKTEEIKEEAQEDLEMLMGAVREKDDEEEQKDRLQGLKDLRENIRDRLSFRSKDEGEEDDNGMEKSEVIDLLEDYQELERYESAIKTAHIMKGFLEYSEGIDRELTYRELTEEIDARTDEMELLLDFFDDMQKDQYTGNIDADMDEVIDAAKTVVRERG